MTITLVLCAWGADFVVPRDGDLTAALDAADPGIGGTYTVALDRGSWSHTRGAMAWGGTVELVALVPGEVSIVPPATPTSGNLFEIEGGTLRIEGIDLDCGTGRCIRASDTSVVELEGVRIHGDNTAPQLLEGRGVYLTQQASLTVRRSVFEPLWSTYGGHIRAVKGPVVLEESAFFGGRAVGRGYDFANAIVDEGGNGGSVHSTGALTIDRSYFQDQGAFRGVDDDGTPIGGHGGAVFVREGQIFDAYAPPVTVRDSTFVEAQAEGQGGALRVAGSLTLERSHFCNVASLTNHGGGLYWSAYQKRDEQDVPIGPVRSVLEASHNSFVHASAAIGGGGLFLHSNRQAASITVDGNTCADVEGSINGVCLDAVGLVEQVMPGPIIAVTDLLAHGVGDAQGDGDAFVAAARSYFDDAGIEVFVEALQGGLQGPDGFLSATVGSSDASSLPPPPDGCDPLDLQAPSVVGYEGYGALQEVDGIWDHDGDGKVAGEDCDDADPTTYRGAPDDSCDGVDNDCDGRVDEDAGADAAGIQAYYLDMDGDGYGDGGVVVWLCAPPADLYVAEGTDCDDTDEEVHPGATERCNGADDDCDGEVPANELDGDGDGTAVCEGDCDDTDGEVHPGAEERCNGADDDCDGAIPTEEVDGDGDGTAVCEGDCDDTDGEVYPGAEERCNGVDDDCDGAIPTDELDEDGDGYFACGDDCDDTDPALPASWYPDDDGDGYGDGTAEPDLTCDGAPSGYVADDGDCDDGDSAVHPGAAEVCNGVDDDCDDAVDEGLVFETYWPDADGDGAGDATADPVSTCDGAPFGHVADDGDCDDGDSSIHPGADEVCNEVDDDCDGQVDEGCGTPDAPDAPEEPVAEGGGCGCRVGGAPGTGLSLVAMSLLLAVRRRC